LGVNVSLRDSECEDGGVDARGRGLPIRECLGAAQDVDAEDREDTADLVEECLGVGLLSLRELAGLWSLSIVRQGTAFGCSGDFDKSGFKVAPVPFIEGVVTAADEDCPVPPVLFAVVLTESCGEVFSSPDVAGDVLDGIGVIAKKKIDTVAVSLFSGEEASEGCAGAGEDVTSPSRDVRGCDAAGLSVNKEELNVFSTHGIISFQGR
jgi:hypothetical protein